MSNSVVITGQGVICAIGNNKEQVLSSLLHDRHGIAPVKYLNTIHKDLPVGEVHLSNEQMGQMLGINSKYIGRGPLMGIIAIKEALEDAGITKDFVEKNNLKVLLISGTTVGGMDVTESYFSEFVNGNYSNAECLKYHGCGDSTRYMANYFGFFNDSSTISTACSSAANAIILGANLLKSGQADIVVAGGSEALSKFHLNGFNSLMILDKQICRPFDDTRAGLNLGEGAGFLVLETPKTAKLRGRKADACLSGYANACDAFHQTASSDNGEGAYLAMKQALELSGIKPEDIDYINAHGTGTPNNDISESAAIQRVFKDRIPLVSSTKSFTGHTTSASGSIESVFCILALNNGFVPANLGWKNQIPGGITPTLRKDSVNLKNVICNSFGFGGNDSSLIFSAVGQDYLNREDSQNKEDLQISNTKWNTKGSVKVLSKVEIVNERELDALRNYVKPMELRRMDKLMKSTLLSSLQALEKAGIECPDGIITGTAWGCIDNSIKFLNQINENNETMLKPTLFMQSTHNTIGSLIAIRCQCHGYNVTYSHCEKSLEWAIKDAEILLRTSNAKYVLVGCHDQKFDLDYNFNYVNNVVKESGLYSIAMVLTLTE